MKNFLILAALSLMSLPALGSELKCSVMGINQGDPKQEIIPQFQNHLDGKVTLFMGYKVNVTVLGNTEGGLTEEGGENDALLGNKKPFEYLIVLTLNDQYTTALFRSDARRGISVEMIDKIRLQYWNEFLQ